jgi:GAF domain-containing protein/anti-sigma regulatory factor (Ser/Thr protein kinase)
VTQTPEAETAAARGGQGFDTGVSPSLQPQARTDMLLDELLARLCLVMNADVSQFLLVEGDALRVMASHGVPIERVRGLRIPFGRGFSGTIAATASPAIISDTSSLETFGASWAEEGVRALVGVPLVVDSAVLGVAVVGSRSDRTFGDADIQLLSDAAERAAWAVQNGLLLAAERDAQAAVASVRERLARLQAMGEELLTDPSVEGVIAAVVERGLSLIGAIGGGVWSVDRTLESMNLRGVTGYPPDVVERWQALQLEDIAPVSEAARNGQRVVVRSVAERDKRYPALRGGSTIGEAFVAAPLIVDGRTIGVLGLGFAHGHDLDADGLAFIDAAAAQCAAALHRASILESQQRSLEQAREAAERLASLQRLTAALADARDPQRTFAMIVDELTRSLDAAMVALCALDAETATMRIVASHGLAPDVVGNFGEFPFRPGLPATDALIERRPVLVYDATDLQERYAVLEQYGPEGRAWAALPMIIGDREVGALALALPAPQAFPAEDVEYLVALADQCGHALERARLLQVEAASRARLEVLAEAGRIFTAPLDVETTSVHFSRLVVGRIGDAVSVHLRDGDGRYSIAAAEHIDPQMVDVARAIAEQLPEAITDIYDEILAAGESALFAHLDEQDSLATVEDEELRAILAEHPPTSSILLPLIAGGHALGVLSVTTVAGGRPPLQPTDREQLEELGGRLALAIDGARLLRQQTEIAHTLQRSLLPASLPQVPGAEVAVRYLPGAEGVDVGGDFYDVIPLPSGRVGLVVGDVMGRGIRAAAVMGQLRAAVRSYTLEGHSPAALLTRLDRLVGTLEEGLLVTALYAEWDPSRQLVLCSLAGHLPPLLRLPGEEASYLELDPGLPLGVGIQSYTEVEVALPPGALLLAYTDGLVEGPDLPVEIGMDRLLEAIAGATDAMDVCERALAELRPLLADRRYDDDTALLALMATPGAGSSPRSDGNERAFDLPADAGSPAQARAYVAGVLHDWELDSLIESATLLVSEVVTNGVRHAGTGLRLGVGRTNSQRVRVSVTDWAPRVDVKVREASRDAEGGRGLFLVEHLSDGWGSVADDARKTVWFELQA